MEAKQPLRILSLGAGVQSTALLLMSVRGELPKLDAAVFADTGWEPKDVYSHLEWLKNEAASAGIPVHTVVYRNLREDLVQFRVSKKSGNGYTYVPLYLRHSDNTLGMSMRTCTQKYKIGPIDKWLKTFRDNRPVEMWLGITWDEKQRMSASQAAWKKHIYPFCGPEFSEGLRKVRWHRSHCIGWLRQHYGSREVPRSACIGCPYRSNEEWRRIREMPEEWADAIEVDEAIRQQPNLGLDGVPYLHRTAVPLRDADLSAAVIEGASLWDGVADNECEGMCGL